MGEVKTDEHEICRGWRQSESSQSVILCDFIKLDERRLADHVQYSTFKKVCWEIEWHENSRNLWNSVFHGMLELAVRWGVAWVGRDGDGLSCADIWTCHVSRPSSKGILKADQA